MSLYSWALKYIAPMRESVFRTVVEGEELLPQTGPTIFCCSHRTNLDPFLLGLVLPRRLFFMAKAELFRIPLFNKLIRSLGAFPIKRGAGDRQALLHAEEILKAGNMLVMFPEGTRLRAGRIPARFQSGAVRLALRTGAVIVPAAIINEGKTRLFRKKTIRFGKPVTTAELGITVDNHDIDHLRAASARVRERVMELLGVSDDAKAPPETPA